MRSPIHIVDGLGCRGFWGPRVPADREKDIRVADFPPPLGRRDRHASPHENSEPMLYAMKSLRSRRGRETEEPGAHQTYRAGRMLSTHRCCALLGRFAEVVVPSLLALSPAPARRGVQPTTLSSRNPLRLLLSQAAFRGYRLRERLRRLPARAAERTIRDLQRNTAGFRRLATFLVFYAIYFAMVFSSVDVSFERSVKQALQAHLESVQFGPDNSRTYRDVNSVADFHAWIQALFLKTYSGTQLEHPCSACAVRPPDEVCEQCDFPDIFYNGNTPPSWNWSALPSDDLTEECEMCLVGLACAGDTARACNEALGVVVDSNTSSGTSSSSVYSEYVNTTLARQLDLMPLGGVHNAGGYLAIENASQCSNDIDVTVGTTLNLYRSNVLLQVPYDGLGYIGDRNRIVGGLLVVFDRRELLSNGECRSSRDYYDLCLGEEEETEPIIPGESWNIFRPIDQIEFDGGTDSYTVLVDTGGYNVGMNFGYCTLLLLEDLGVLGNNTRSMGINLVTFNGHRRTAFGSIIVNFVIAEGGQVKSSAKVNVSVFSGSLRLKENRLCWLAGIVFFCMLVGAIRYDVKQWCRKKRSKIKRNRFHRCCGIAFYTMIVFNVMLWIAVAALGDNIEISSSYEMSITAQDVMLKQLTKEIVTQTMVTLVSEVYKLVFLITTLLGLYRLLFQKLTFHKRLSIVSDTLRHASTHLDHFLFVFLLVAFVFAKILWLLTGASAVEFSTLDGAWRSIIRISLGESENFYPQILEAQPATGPMIVVLYQVLVVVLLLNVVIAIILEAYRRVVEGMRGEDTIFQSFTAFLGMTYCSWSTRWRWAGSYMMWWMSHRRSQENRPSFKVALQGSTNVLGVDGLPVLMVRRVGSKAQRLAERQFSWNCPRYISVKEMKALVMAAPVPSFVAERLVRKIVHEWVFVSEEKLPFGPAARLNGSMLRSRD